MARQVFLCAVAWLVMGVSAAQPQAQSAEFSLSIRGLKVGEISLAATLSPSAYALSGQLRNTGLTRVIRNFDYAGTVNGRASGSDLAPTTYVERADTGRRESSVEMQYRNGVPKVVRYRSNIPAPDTLLDPATMTGALDPLTAIYTLLRDIDPAQACQLNITIFDGRRESRLWARRAGTENGRPVCAGRFERLRGYRPEELEKHTHFDYRLTYSDAPDGRLRVQRVAFDSLYGQAVIDRR